MPRIIFPSQVTATIDRLFPHVASGSAPRATYSIGNAKELRGIVNLVRDIPSELIVLPPDDYAMLVVANSAIEQQLEMWLSDASTALVFAQGDPVLVIRRALAQCPDEYPPPATTTELSFVTDDDLRESIRLDVGGAHRAVLGGEWKAATVLAGAGIEALLHWKLNQPSVPATARNQAISTLVRKGTLPKSPGTNLDRWGLHEFIEVAGHLQIIHPSTVKAADLARDFRNLIHPGAAARRNQFCDRATALSALAGLEHVIRDLG